MAAANNLPIYKVAYDLFGVVTDAVRNMPRDVKQLVGSRVATEAMDIVTLIFRANAATNKVPHLSELLAIHIPGAYTRLNVGRQPACRFGDLDSLAHISRAVTRLAALLFVRALGSGSYGRLRVGIPSGMPVPETGSPTLLGSRSPVWRRVAVKETALWSCTMTAHAQGALALDVSPASAFKFGDHAVRVVLRDGEPWFVATDICSALGYANTSKAVGDHLDADERARADVPTPNAPLGVPTNIINESGLYALVLRSRKPEARRFAKWVTGEVLPTIRKTGAYHSLNRAVNPSDLLRGRYFVYGEPGGKLIFTPVPEGAFVVTPEQFASVLREPGVATKHLSEILTAVATRIAGIAMRHSC